MTDWWDDQELVSKVLKEAQNGNAVIQCELAAKLMEKGYAQDSIAWYKRAAAQGNTDAMFNLGILYTGMREGFAAVPEQAFFWFEQGALHGDAEAKFMAARFLLDGFGTQKDVEKAGKLAEEALASGFAQAAELLKQIPGKQEERDDKMALIESIAAEAEKYLAVEDFEGARKPMEEAVDKSTELLGEADACTLMLVGNLAFVYSKLGEYDLSIACREKIVEIRQNTLGNSHPEFLIASLNLSSEYGKAGRLQSALALTRQAYNTTRTAYESMHELSLLALNRYAADLCACGKFLQAEKLLKEEQVFFKEHEEELEAMKDLPQAATVIKRVDRSKELLAHCQNVIREHEAYFALSEDRREYAWICAEIDEMLSSLPENYREKIDQAELDHYKEQAALASCYKAHMTNGNGVEMEPYADALQALLSLKYLMPPMAVCSEEHALGRVKAVVTWVHNELCLILTVYGRKSLVDHMEHPIPIDYVKGLNKLCENGEEVEAEDKVVSVNEVALSLEEKEEGVLKIHFTYGYEHGKREIVLYYEENHGQIHAPAGFSQV